MTVMIGFSTRKYNPLSALIRKVTKSSASHAWMLYYDPFFSRPMVFEATEWGIRVIDAGLFWERNKVVSVFNPKVNLTKAVKASGNLLGGLYDFFGLFGMAFVLAWARWFHRKIRNPLENPRGMFCSELVVAKMEESKYPGMTEMPSTVSPMALMEFLDRNGDRLIDFPASPDDCFRSLVTYHDKPKQE